MTVSRQQHSSGLRLNVALPRPMDPGAVPSAPVTLTQQSWLSSETRTEGLQALRLGGSEGPRTSTGGLMGIQTSPSYQWKAQKRGPGKQGNGWGWGPGVPQRLHASGLTGVCV